MYISAFSLYNYIQWLIPCLQIKNVKNKMFKIFYPNISLNEKKVNYL